MLAASAIQIPPPPKELEKSALWKFLKKSQHSGGPVQLPNDKIIEDLISKKFRSLEKNRNGYDAVSPYSMKKIPNTVQYNNTKKYLNYVLTLLNQKMKDQDGFSDDQHKQLKNTILKNANSGINILTLDDLDSDFKLNDNLAETLANSEDLSSHEPYMPKSDFEVEEVVAEETEFQAEIGLTEETIIEDVQGEEDLEEVTPMSVDEAGNLQSGAIEQDPNIISYNELTSLVYAAVSGDKNDGAIAKLKENNPQAWAFFQANAKTMEGHLLSLMNDFDSKTGELRVKEPKQGIMTEFMRKSMETNEFNVVDMMAVFNADAVLGTKLKLLPPAPLPLPKMETILRAQQDAKIDPFTANRSAEEKLQTMIKYSENIIAQAGVTRAMEITDYCTDHFVENFAPNVQSEEELDAGYRICTALKEKSVAIRENQLFLDYKPL